MAEGMSGLLAELREQLLLLGLSGVGGALFQALVAPGATWRHTLTRGLAGAVSAIFLGPILAPWIQALGVISDQNAFLASGFLMGAGGQSLVLKLQTRLFARK